MDVSVIVPAYRANATLSSTVDSLAAQRFSGSFEVIVVASADHPDELPRLPRHLVVRCETCVPRLSAAAARNRGAHLARGALLAFTDADVVAADGWLEQLVAASENRWCAAGAIANGTPGSAVGTAEYLVEFFDLSPARIGPSEHGATCNLLLPRQLWETFGPFPEDMDGCEDTWLTQRLLAAGLLRFSGRAIVYHMNRGALHEVLAHQYRLGRSHARLAAKQDAELGSPIADAVTATAGRIRYLYRMLKRWAPEELGRATRLGPLVIAVFAAWGTGLAVESLRLGQRQLALAS